MGIVNGDFNISPTTFLREAYSMIGTDLLKDMDYWVGAQVGLQMAHIGDISVNVRDFLACYMHEVTFWVKQSHSSVAPECGCNALAAVAVAPLGVLGVSRHSQGFSRVNVANLIAKGESNIIPAEASMVIEVRGETNEVNDFMSRRADEICVSAAAMHGRRYERRYLGGCLECGL